MKRQLIHKLTASMMIAAGILIVNPESIIAQNQSQPKHSGTHQGKAEGNTTTTRSASGGKEAAKRNPDEAMFVKKAAESNLAEIQLSELAMKKSSNQQVKDYAQMMIKHHTMAQSELASMVSNYAHAGGGSSNGDADKMATTGATGGTTGNTMANGKSNGQNNSSQNAQSGTDKPNASGSTTATGSTYNSGNANGAIGTTGNTAGRSADGAASNNTPGTGTNNGNASNNADANATTNPSMSPSQVGRGQTSEPGNVTPTEGSSDSNDANDGTGGGGAGGNSGGTTSSMSNAREGRTTTDSQDNNQGSGASASGNMTGGGVNTVSSAMKYDIPNELSAEHKALREKLVKLSGAEFDKQYMQAMVKDHQKSVELFEKQSYKTDNEQMTAFASKNLPIIKEHLEKAKSLAESTGMSKGSSGK